MEYAKVSKAMAFQTIEEKIRTNTQEILENMRTENILPREAAVKMAEARLHRAMDGRRWSIF